MSVQPHPYTRCSNIQRYRPPKSGRSSITWLRNGRAKYSLLRNAWENGKDSAIYPGRHFWPRAEIFGFIREQLLAVAMACVLAYVGAWFRIRVNKRRERIREATPRFSLRVRLRVFPDSNASIDSINEPRAEKGHHAFRGRIAPCGLW